MSLNHSRITIAERSNTESQKAELAKSFICEFLPKTGNVKAYSGRELDYVTRT